MWTTITELNGATNEVTGSTSAVTCFSNRSASSSASAWRAATWSFAPLTIECAGGCGYAPVVVVDSRYHEPVAPEDVPALVEEIRAES